MRVKDLLFFSIVTFLIVLCWIAFDVYHTISTSTVTKVQEKYMQPFDSQFDQETILRILERREPQ